MAGTRSTSRLQRQEPSQGNQTDTAVTTQSTPVESSTLRSAETSQEGQEDTIASERLLQQRLEELQRRERIAQLQRKVRAWEEKEAAGFPDTVVEPPPIGVPAARASTARSTSVATPSSSARPTPHAREEEEDESGPQGKRRKTDDPIHLQEPPKYRARTFREYTSFVRACEQHFEAYPQKYRTARAKRFILKVWTEGDAQEAVYRRFDKPDVESLDWPELKQFLQSLLAPDQERTEEASAAYHGAKQRRDQTVAAFVTYVEGLEKRLHPVSEENRVAHLIQALRQDVKTEVLSRNEKLTTRNNLIEAAMRAEHVLRLRERGQREERRPTPIIQRTETTSATYRTTPGRFSSSARGGTARTTNTRTFSGVNQVPLTMRPRHNAAAGPATPRDKSKDACNYCGKLGHWERDCLSKQNGKPPAGKARAQ